MKKNFQKLTACLLAAAMAATPAFASAEDAAISLISDENAVTLITSAAPATSAAVIVSPSPDRVSVHDPSISKDKNGIYYAFGSHIDAAKSADLVNWVTFTNGYASSDNVLFGDIEENLAKPFAWAGCRDVDARLYSVWAPDVFWNDAYVNEDGTTGAYMMYFCTTSTYKRSCISFGVSQNIEGPYTYVDTLIYSDFTKESTFDNGSSVDKKYTNTNIDELIAEGRLDGLNESWFSGDTWYDTAYAPNAIDPELFYDENGKLWMTYGSWSGGIFILEVDPKTGDVIYPGKSSVTEDGLIVDSYFGTRIGGGYTKSGEGPFIVYDKESGYYYLYMSYEALQADGGYHMRLFRSKNPDGPYLDAKGNNAALEGRVDHTDIGIKVMGNYKFSCLQNAYKAGGHNSAMIDEDGQRYLIYHTRFANMWEMHQVRVHQQFLNEEGWPVTAVFENQHDEISQTGYKLSDIVGDYEFVNHGIESDLANVHYAQTITLNEDGTITGAVTGTWSQKNGTYYMNAVIDDVTYSGVFFLQHDESSECKKVMTFTAIGTNNMTIWGVRKEAYAVSDAEITARVLGDLEKDCIIPDMVTSSLTLPTEGYQDTVITWDSSQPSVITKEGTVTRQEQTEAVTLTATITHGTSSITKTYSVQVAQAKVSPDYIFDFEQVSGTEVANTAAVNTSASAILNGTATVSMDAGIGNVLTITSSGDNKTENYLALPKELLSTAGTSGYTLSMWVKPDDSINTEESIVFSAASPDGRPYNRVYFSTASELHDGMYYYDSSTGISLDSNKWSLLTYVVTPDGFYTYVNGGKRGVCDDAVGNSISNDILSKMTTIHVGTGIYSSMEETASVSFDNIEFYPVALSDTEILEKYQAEQNAYPDFTIEFSRKTLYYGGNTKNTASITTTCDAERAYTVSYASDDTSIVTVDENGALTAVSPGKTTITTTISIDGQTKTFTHKVTVKEASIKISKKKKTLKIGKSATFKVKGYGVKISNAKWSSSKSSILAVNKKTGKVTAKKAGKAKITVTYKGFKASVTVKVKK